jgi:hypothetical protein
VGCFKDILEPSHISAPAGRSLLRPGQSSSLHTAAATLLATHTYFIPPCVGGAAQAGEGGVPRGGDPAAAAPPQRLRLCHPAQGAGGLEADGDAQGEGRGPACGQGAGGPQAAAAQGDQAAADHRQVGTASVQVVHWVQHDDASTLGTKLLLQQMVCSRPSINY